jgi:hypothetical protein
MRLEARQTSSSRLQELSSLATPSPASAEILRASFVAAPLAQGEQASIDGLC